MGELPIIRETDVTKSHRKPCARKTAREARHAPKGPLGPLCWVWRRVRDYSALSASPFGPSPAATFGRRYASPVEPPFSISRVRIPIPRGPYVRKGPLGPLCWVWRRVRDYSALCASPFGPSPAATFGCRCASPVEPSFSMSRVRISIPRGPYVRKGPLGPLCWVWRRVRDSNPRWAFDPYSLSRGAPSTTRPTLRNARHRIRTCAHKEKARRLPQPPGLTGLVSRRARKPPHSLPGRTHRRTSPDHRRSRWIRAEYAGRSPRGGPPRPEAH